MTRIYRAFAAVLSVMSIVAMPVLHAEKVHTVTVHAKRYAFVPAEITLRKGEAVKLKLISDDVDHGLAVKGLSLRADMPKGKPV